MRLNCKNYDGNMSFINPVVLLRYEFAQIWAWPISDFSPIFEIVSRYAHQMSSN